MYRFIGLMACAAIFTSLARADGDRSMTDLATLQGSWELPGHTDRSARRTLEVKGSTFIFRAGDNITRKVTATLDATKQPKAMDLKEQGEAQPFLTIYKIEKDRITFCIGVDKARPTNTRPTRFEATAGQALVTYVKVKR